MAALVQSYPQQSGTVTMLQTRPASASGILPSGQSQGQQFGGNQSQRNSYYGASGPVGGQATYRGSSVPVQPYAFTSTPSLHPNGQWQQGPAMRASSSSAVPTVHSFDASTAGRPRYPASVSMSHLPSTFSGGYAPVGSRDDSSLPSTAVGGRRFSGAAPRPQSAYITGATTATATQVTFTQATPVKVSPDRYRRPGPRAVDPAGPSPQSRPQISSAQASGSGMASVGHLYNPHPNSEQRPNLPRSRTPSATNSRPTSLYSSSNSFQSVDDMQLPRQQPQDDIKRLRRRSMPALDAADFPKSLIPPPALDIKLPELQLASSKISDGEQKPAGAVAANGLGNGNSGVASAPSGGNIMHIRNGSSESLASTRSSGSRPSSAANRDPSASTPAANPAIPTTIADQSVSSNQDYPRLVNIPPRSSSSDASKNTLNPSPLSRPMTMESESDVGGTTVSVEPVPSPSKTPDSPRVPEHHSPAVQQLAAISKKTARPKSKTSRLRRAFSFGSAAEFRKATIPEESAVDNVQDSHAPSKLHKEPTSEELYDAEQARIAEQQEAAGIGHSIYAGAKIFAGSTDNISISSTASSASIMIRKMGRGMKKGTRSLVGLFRPKSVSGAPTAEAQPSEASQAAVSMITVEAERERVNVNVDPHAQNGGGTGFPRLERNSMEAVKPGSTGSDRLGSSDTDNSAARKSIVGGDRERAEVLAAVRKGILKHRGASNSPPRQASVVVLPNVPAMTDSPNSSAPSTPNDEAQGHKRSGSVAIGSEDYFMTALRLRQETRSAPVTPQSGTPTATLRRNATFSPRIIFYDTWPSQEYDRRSEISTCNRLTPMLAQQIKEELNSFKMEMEVHETSKIYTQFF